MKRTFVTTLVVLFAAIISPIFAITPSTSILVYVKTADNLPVEGINLSITSESYNDAGVSDSQGKVTFDVTDARADTYAITISLSGANYELVSGEVATKSVTIADDEQKAVYFGVKEKAAVVDETNDNKTIDIPSEFYSSGSKTTVLKDMTSDQLKAVSGFIIHKPDLAKIEFKEKVDLSSTTTINKLETLDQYVFIEIPGEVSLASDLIPELNKPATVTLEGLNFVQLSQGYTPMIMKDDQDAGTSVSNISLINGDKISFDVSSFSSYAVRPTFEFEENEIETDQTTYTLNGKIDDLDSQISIYVNDESQNLIIDINDKGEFEIPIELTEKENVVQVLAIGASEQTYSEVVKITNPNLEETVADSSGMSINLTLVFGILLFAMAIGGGAGYYYYNKKQKVKSPKIATKYDNRLLTPEERVRLADDSKKPDDSTPKEKIEHAQEEQTPKL